MTSMGKKFTRCILTFLEIKLKEIIRDIKILFENVFFRIISLPQLLVEDAFEFCWYFNISYISVCLYTRHPLISLSLSALSHPSSYEAVRFLWKMIIYELIKSVSYIEILYHLVS